MTRDNTVKCRIMRGERRGGNGVDVCNQSLGYENSTIFDKYKLNILYKISGMK